MVAAVGNADQAPTSPWPYASYPAALPHVMGVSALARDGSVPFSNRDPIYNDIAAPGEDIVSTFPRQLTNDRPTCDEQGTRRAAEEYRRAEDVLCRAAGCGYSGAPARDATDAPA